MWPATQTPGPDTPAGRLSDLLLPDDEICGATAQTDRRLRLGYFHLDVKDSGLDRLWLSLYDPSGGLLGATAFYPYGNGRNADIERSVDGCGDKMVPGGAYHCRLVELGFWISRVLDFLRDGRRREDGNAGLPG